MISASEELREQRDLRDRVELLAEANLPTELGDFRLLGFRAKQTGEDFVVLLKGERETLLPTLVRIHSQCLTGDVFHSIKCDCGRQLAAAMEMVQRAGQGVIIYQPQEGRGIGIINKIRAYALQDQGADTIEANLKLGFEIDARSYEDCVAILQVLGIRAVRLISNNPEKLAALAAGGFESLERVPLEVDVDVLEPAHGYLKTKKEKMGHMLSL
jgi:GTP cyclohydrolase II